MFKYIITGAITGLIMYTVEHIISKSSKDNDSPPNIVGCIIAGTAYGFVACMAD